MLPRAPLSAGARSFADYRPIRSVYGCGGVV